MTPLEAKTLQACLMTLAQEDPPLTEADRRAIGQWGQAIRQGDTRPIDSLRQLITQDPQRQTHYEAAMATLWTEDPQQERTKSLALALTHRAAPLTLEELAWEVLTSPDDCALAVKRIVDKLKPTPQLNTDPFLGSLRQVAQTLDAQSRSILEELDRHPLSLKSLSYRLQQPPERAQGLVNQLWQGGYIDALEGGALRKVFTALRPTEPPNGNTYFTLTAKGHFYLHPIISRRR